MSDEIKQETSENKIVYMPNYIHENQDFVNTELDETGEKVAGETDNTDTNDSDEQPRFLPTPLHAYQRKLYVGSAVIGLAGVSTALFLHSYAPLLLLLGTLYLAFKAFSVRHDYFTGTIVECGVVCSSVRPSQIRDRVSVTFRSHDGDNASYYLFVVPRRHDADEFIPDCQYVIYFDVSNPHALLAYMPL